MHRGGFYLVRRAPCTGEALFGASRPLHRGGFFGGNLSMHRHTVQELPILKVFPISSGTNQSFRNSARMESRSKSVSDWVGAGRWGRGRGASAGRGRLGVTFFPVWLPCARGAGRPEAGLRGCEVSALPGSVTTPPPLRGTSPCTGEALGGADFLAPLID